MFGISRRCASIRCSSCLHLSVPINTLALRKYTLDHEWVSVKNNVATIGITDYAQKALGDVVYIDLPPTGKQFARKDTIGAVESVKAASDIYSPVSGSVVERNEALESSPSLVNTDPYNKGASVQKTSLTLGWIARIKLRDSTELDGLMDELAYAKHISE